LAKVTVIIEATVQHADKPVQRCPRKSVSYPPQQLSLSTGTTCIILRGNLKMIAYKIQLLQKRCKKFYRAFPDFAEPNPRTMNKICLTNAANFLLNVIAKKQNGGL
jgi:hypothetical protein